MLKNSGDLEKEVARKPGKKNSSFKPMKIVPAAIYSAIVFCIFFSGKVHIN